MSVALQAVPFFENPLLGRYATEAMKTTFRIFVPGGDRALVDSAVSGAFQKLEELEGVLSRYIPGSDVSRINAMKTGESLFLSDECDACLRLALEAFTMTGGVFDPCAGMLVDAVKSGCGGGMQFNGCLALAPDRPLITCVEEGRVVDLGGIGKGFALERMGEILAAHGLEDALLTSGASTMLAMEKNPGRSRFRTAREQGESNSADPLLEHRETHSREFTSSIPLPAAELPTTGESGSNIPGHPLRTPCQRPASS